MKERMNDTMTQQTNKRTNEWMNELPNLRAFHMLLKIFQKVSPYF